jgi:hypothetical protein
MARGKKTRNTDSSAFSDAVDASSQLDGTGVEFEDGEPVVIVKLSEEEQRQAGEHLAAKLAELAAVEQDQKDTAAKFRKDVKARKKAIAELRDEVISGTRKEAAQATLPGTVQ